MAWWRRAAAGGCGSFVGRRRGWAGGAGGGGWASRLGLGYLRAMGRGQGRSAAIHGCRQAAWVVIGRGAALASSGARGVGLALVPPWGPLRRRVAWALAGVGGLGQRIACIRSWEDDDALSMDTAHTGSQPCTHTRTHTTPQLSPFGTPARVGRGCRVVAREQQLASEALFPRRSRSSEEQARDY